MSNFTRNLFWLLGGVVIGGVGWGYFGSPSRQAATLAPTPLIVDNQVWLVKQLTDNNIPKGGVAVSPDGKKIFYSSMPIPDTRTKFDGSLAAFRVVNPIGKELRQMEYSTSSFLAAVESVVWLDNDRVAIEFHSGPRGAILLVYDYPQNKVEEKDYAGFDFSWSPDKRHVAYLNPSQDRNSPISVDGDENVVYPPESDEADHFIASNIAWNPDGKIAFVERDKEQFFLIAVSVLDNNGLPIKNAAIERRSVLPPKKEDAEWLVKWDSGKKMFIAEPQIPSAD